MVSRRSSTSQSAKPAAGSSPHSATTHPGDTSHDVAAKQDPSNPDDPPQKQSASRTALLLVSAIPQITEEFNSLADVGWYGSAYLLTCCAFQLLFGKLYTLYSVKGVFLTTILLFEFASALCGAAPGSAVFIVGRAISGVGAAGIFAGTIVCIVYIVPLHKRAQIQGLFGALFGLASIVGPLVGGAFTSQLTWRWCFYINLPLGGVAMAVIAIYLKVPDRDTTKLPWAKKLSQLDVLGTALLIPGVVCLLLALQWGGQAYSIFLPTTGTLPPRIFKQRSIVAGFLQTICVNSGNYIFIYFLPIWFQAIKGVSAVESGIRLLPLMLSTVVGSVASGIITSKIGYYTPFAIVGSCVMSIGAGLLTTFQVATGTGKWIGYQVLYGIGLGLCFQVPNLAAQTTLPKNDVPVGLALMLFGSLLGSAVFVSVGENVLGNQLVQRLSGVPGFDPSLVTSGGATSILSSLPANLRVTVLTAYNEALRKVFQVGLIISCLAVLGAAALEWRSILEKPEAHVDAESSGMAEKKKAGES
ncbi:hypothetical protein DL765_000396 [Monosporascus sp. GIB2]|nr:hypothetical protein DL765_000396 [Monosporascus sp. GIB2]